MTERSPFRHFRTNPKIIRLAMMLHIRCPMSLRNLNDLLHAPGFEISHLASQEWWNPMAKSSRQASAATLVE